MCWLSTENRLLFQICLKDLDGPILSPLGVRGESKEQTEKEFWLESCPAPYFAKSG